MSNFLHPIESEWASREVQDGEVITRVWQVKYGSTLQSLEQERGDIVNGTDYYEILSSHIGHLKGKMQHKVVVTGFRSDLFAGEARTGTFRELLSSRRSKKTRNTTVYQRKWECDSLTAIKEGENGWGAYTDAITVASQIGSTITWTSGSKFYPAMIGLPLDLTTGTDSYVTDYYSPTSIRSSELSISPTSITITYRGKLPVEIGDEYENGTWSNRIAPACVDVSVDNSWTVKRSLITGTYSASRIN